MDDVVKHFTKRSLSVWQRHADRNRKGSAMSAPRPSTCSEEHLGAPPPLTEERMALIAKALAHPERVRIVEQFEDCRPRMVHEIVQHSDLAQSTASEHLRILREAGVLFATKDGPRAWYCMRRSVLRQFAEAVDDLTVEPTSRLGQLTECLQWHGWACPPAGSYEFDVDGRYWTDFDCQHPIEGPARSQAWSGTVCGLFAQFGVGTITHSALQVGLAVAVIYAGVGFFALLSSAGLIWASRTKDEDVFPDIVPEEMKEEVLKS
jgi:ArsR family transcriptional regulator